MKLFYLQCTLLSVLWSRALLYKEKYLVILYFLTELKNQHSDSTHQTLRVASIAHKCSVYAFFLPECLIDKGSSKIYGLVCLWKLLQWYLTDLCPVLTDLYSSFPSCFEKTTSNNFSAASLTFSVHPFCTNNSPFSVQSASRAPLTQLTSVRDFPSWLLSHSFLCAVTAEKWLCGRLKLVFCDEGYKWSGKEKKKKDSVLVCRFWGGENLDCNIQKANISSHGQNYTVEWIYYNIRNNFISLWVLPGFKRIMKLFFQQN